MDAIVERSSADPSTALLFLRTMSGRLSRRLQRQQEELAKLQALSTPVPTAEEADPVEVDTTETEGASVAPSQGFASVRACAYAARPG